MSFVSNFVRQLADRISDFTLSCDYTPRLVPISCKALEPEEGYGEESGLFISQ